MERRHRHGAVRPVCGPAGAGRVYRVWLPCQKRGCVAESPRGPACARGIPGAVFSCIGNPAGCGQHPTAGAVHNRTAESYSHHPERQGQHGTDERNHGPSGNRHSRIIRQRPLQSLPHHDGKIPQLQLQQHLADCHAGRPTGGGLQQVERHVPPHRKERRKRHQNPCSCAVQGQAEDGKAGRTGQADSGQGRQAADGRKNGADSGVQGGVCVRCQPDRGRTAAVHCCECAFWQRAGLPRFFQGVGADFPGAHRV